MGSADPEESGFAGCLRACPEHRRRGAPQIHILSPFPAEPVLSLPKERGQGDGRPDRLEVPPCGVGIQHPASTLSLVG